MSAKNVAAQRAMQKGPSLTIPKGTPTLTKVAPITTGVTNNHQSNPGGGRKGLTSGEAPRRGE